MATAYYSPGVYIEEVDKGPKPIQGVSTSITAFVGITEKAELVNEDGYTTRSLLSEPKLITNWTQYENYFGGFSENAYLPYAVRGFFDNGGVTAWVISIHALNAHPAQALLYASHPKDENKIGAPSLLIHARAGGMQGEKIKVSIVPNGGGGGDSGSAPPPPPAADTDNRPPGSRGRRGAEAAATAEIKESSPTVAPSDSVPGSSGESGAGASAGGPPPPPPGGSNPAAPDLFTLVVQNGDDAPQRYPLRLDNLPLWTNPEREPAEAHKIKTGRKNADGTDETIEIAHVKVWRLTKNGKLAERLPKPVADLTLSGGVAKFDLELVQEADRELVRGNPTSKEESEILERNAIQLFNGSATLRKGAEGLEAIDNLNLICAPDLVGLHKNKVIDDQQLIGLQKSLLSFCERTHYRFAILDSPYDRKLPEKILAWKQNTDQANFDSMYGALYYPWLKITDPLTGKTKEIPPCGHIAGIYARSDTQRGVHKAPANEQVMGPITNVTINVTKGEQDLLNPVGINCIRAFPGRGIRVWGARTLTSDPAWRYINVRRLFNYVEESVERSTQWVVFEPNDYFLWARVRRDITAFLNTVWVSGALFGLSPDQAFFVKCDEELNPQEIRDQGMMICEIGMAPVKPAEFVIFRFSQYAMVAG